MKSRQSTLVGSNRPRASRNPANALNSASWRLIVALDRPAITNATITRADASRTCGPPRTARHARHWAIGVDDCDRGRSRESDLPLRRSPARLVRNEPCVIDAELRAAKAFAVKAPTDLRRCRGGADDRRGQG